MRVQSAYLRGIALAGARPMVVDDEDDQILAQDDDTEAVATTAVADVDAVDAGGTPAPVIPDTALQPVPAPDDAGTPPATVQPVARAHRVLKSELEGVSDEAWTDFALALKTAQIGAVSASNAYGMFELKPRRLADLGLIRNVFNTRGPTNRMVWVGEWVPPMTQKKFLSSPTEQYKAMAKSMNDYVARLRSGSIPRPDGGKPQGMSLSGALAILHRCGPSGLKTWNDEPNRFPETAALYQKANGIF